MARLGRGSRGSKGSSGSKGLVRSGFKVVPAGRNVLVIPGPKFYSLKDEDLFFSWLYSLRAFKNVLGAGRELAITFRTSRLSRADSNELAAIFQRYALDMRLLRDLLAPAKNWQDPRPHWIKAVFGRSAS